MTEPARPSFLTRFRLRWQRRAADALAWGKQIRPGARATEGSAPVSSARSSMFHLRMEQKHRTHYDEAARRQAGPTGSSPTRKQP